MRTIITRLLACAALLTAGARAQTINWGGEIFSELRDSRGLTLGDLYVFELGAFDPGMDPTVQPLPEDPGSWLEHWNVFDRASHNESLGYFTGTVEMTDNGLSNSPWLAADIPSFEGLAAYIWIRKGDTPVPGSEWLVVRASDWAFPAAIPGCCDNSLPVEWSVSDLTTSDTPAWGAQGNVAGPGEYTYGGGATLQTHTFSLVPEPSAAVLLPLLALTAISRRRGD